MHEPHEQNDRTIKTTLPDAWSRRITHAATDLGIHRHELMREAVLLALHRLGYGAGLRVSNLPEKEEA